MLKNNVSLDGNSPLSKNKFISLLMRSDGAVSVVVVLFGFLFGTILVAVVGRNPLNMYKALIQSVTGLYTNRKGELVWNARYIGEWLTLSVPYILCGLCMAFADRAGLFNIGGEGQYIIGLTVAQYVALKGFQIPGFHWMAAIILAILAGAIWSGAVGFLKAKYEVSEVVSTIMLNYVALYLSRIVMFSIPGTNTYKTANFPETALIRWSFLSNISNGSNLNLGFFLAIISVVLYWFLMEKTNLGFSLRATGYNKDAARCSGISVVKSIVIAMAISGAFAGLAGATVALGSFKYGRVLSGQDNYGFTGIAVALVGNDTASGTLLAGLLFGMLAAAQPIMQSQQIPKEITFLIQGVIVVFIAIREGIRIFLRWRIRKSAETMVTNADGSSEKEISTETLKNNSKGEDHE